MAKAQKKGFERVLHDHLSDWTWFFFTMGGLMDPLYDTYVPIFLSRFVESKALIGQS